MGEQKDEGEQGLSGVSGSGEMAGGWPWGLFSVDVPTFSLSAVGKGHSIGSLILINDLC